MRIKKPRQNEEYKIYPTIDQRNQDEKNLVNGQEVKILDASKDPEIESGWAIYKYDKANIVFDLLEKEHESVYKPEYYEFPTLSEAMRLKDTIKSGATIKILDASGDPKVKQGFAFYLIDGEKSGYSGMKLISKEGEIAPDGVTIFKTDNEKLSVPDAMISNRTDIRILEDFDFSLTYDGTDMILEPIGGTRTIPIMCGNTKKFLTICPYKLSFKIFDNQGKGKRVNWTIEANISDTDQTITTQVIGFVDSGETVIVKPKPSDVQLSIMQVSVLVPYSGTPLAKDFFIYKYWKKALAPVEERFIPEIDIPNVDNITIVDRVAGGKLFSIPELQHAYYEDVKIMKDFSLIAKVNSSLRKIDISFNGSSEMLSIPVKTGSGIKYLKLIPFTIDANTLGSCKKGSPVYIIVSGYLKDTGEEEVSAMPMSRFTDGSATRLNPRNVVVDKQMAVFQLRIMVPAQTYFSWHQSMVTVFKTWEQALSPAEERIVIPEPETHEHNYTQPDGQTIKFVDGKLVAQFPQTTGYYSDKASVMITNSKRLAVPDAMTSNRLDFIVLEDFDYELEMTNSKIIDISPVGGVHTVPVMVEGVKKYMSLSKRRFSLTSFTDYGKGKRVHWTFTVNISDADVFNSSNSINANSHGDPVIVLPSQPRTSFLMLQISVLVSSSGVLNSDSIIIHKYWKKALAPLQADNHTVEQTDNVLTVPAALNPIMHNYTIKKNFQLSLNFDDKTFIKVKFKGANETGGLIVPIEVVNTNIVQNEKPFCNTLNLHLGEFNIPVSAVGGTSEYIHFGIMANRSGGDANTLNIESCSYIVEADGSPITFKPNPADTKICIAQIRVKRPINTDGWREESVTVWKYWRACVSEESSGAPAVDGYGVEYINLNGVKTLSSVGGMTSNYYTLRYLQDFDFDFKAIFNHETGNLIFVTNPIGGNKVIKATRTGGHTDGSSLPKQTHFVSIKTLDAQLNGLERGKYHYLRFGSSMPTVEPSSPQNMFSHVSPEPDIKPNNNYSVNYGIVKIYIPKVGEAFDPGKIYVYKYWKNALATFDELMQDYQQRNP